MVEDDVEFSWTALLGYTFGVLLERNLASSRHGGDSVDPQTRLRQGLHSSHSLSTCLRSVEIVGSQEERNVLSESELRSMGAQPSPLELPRLLLGYGFECNHGAYMDMNEWDEEAQLHIDTDCIL